MSNMTKEKKVTYHVEGPDWVYEAELDTEIFESEAEQLFEAATRGIEDQLKEKEELNVGAIIIVKKGKSTREALVNSYICLNNAGQHQLAEKLRENFKKQSGQDLAVDETGYSY